MPSADLYARAIIASAISFGDDPIKALSIPTGTGRRCLAPAIVGLALATETPMRRISPVIRYDHTSISRARQSNPLAFQKAQDAAEEAVRYAMKGERWKAAVAPVPAPPPPPPPPPRPVAPARPARKVRPRAPSSIGEVRQRQVERNAQRLSMRGKISTTRHDGVQVIRLKPISPEILARAKQQTAKGLSVAEFADLFNVDEEALAKALDADKGLEHVSAPVARVIDALTPKDERGAA